MRVDIRIPLFTTLLNENNVCSPVFATESICNNYHSALSKPHQFVLIPDCLTAVILYIHSDGLYALFKKAQEILLQDHVSVPSPEGKSEVVQNEAVSASIFLVETVSFTRRRSFNKQSEGTFYRIKSSVLFQHGIWLMASTEMVF
jgi:hypothetical protein